MADFIMSSDLVVRGGGGAMVKGASPSVTPGSWECASGLDQITVVRIDDTHIAGERSQETADFYGMEYSMAGQEAMAGEEEQEEEEEEEDSVFVIEYSNPEEEGESYQFTMSVDRSLPARKPEVKPALVRGKSASPLPPLAPRPGRLYREVRQKRKLTDEEEVKEEMVEGPVSNKSVLELGEDYSDMMKRKVGAGKAQLFCKLCPPPGRFFKRASGLAVHLKQMHLMEGKKTFFCTSCSQTVRTQVELDAHTRRHANHEAVFICHVCSPDQPGYQGSRWGLRRHLEREHPGVIPSCNICHKSFKSLVSYLADQFRHVGVSPYYCARCQIYEMTERGLSVHIRNHYKKKEEEEPGEKSADAERADNSATDDSDF